MTAKQSGGIKGGLITFLILFSILSFANPNFNTIDIFPDFIGYFILFALVGKYAPLAPYFEEVKDGLLKLGVITLIKLPMMVVMIMNMSKGSDIVPLLTLIFVTLELIVAIPLVRDIFLALFYLGERGGCMAAITPITVFGLPMSVETARAVAYIFVVVKGVLNVVPEFCLLSTTDDSVAKEMRELYPRLETICFLAVLVLSIFFYIVAVSYVLKLKHNGGIEEYAIYVAGDKKLALLDYERGVKSKLFGLTLIAVASIFTIDVVVDGGGEFGSGIGINLIPRCLFALILSLAIFRLTDKRVYRILAVVSALLYSIFSISTLILTYGFNEIYTHEDLIEGAMAKSAYLPIIITTSLETVFMLLLAIVFTLVFRESLKRDTTLDFAAPKSRGAIEGGRKIRLGGYLLTLSPFFISLLKLIDTFLIYNSQYVYANPDDVTMPIMVSSALPWFGFIIMAASIGYVLFTYYYLLEVKSEVKMKYSNDEIVFS